MYLFLKIPKKIFFETNFGLFFTETKIFLSQLLYLFHLTNIKNNIF